jgi:tryptophanyl-tRNA synthetase
MRPTGKLHLGNYMGALHNWVKLQNQVEEATGEPAYECFFFIADIHALTTDYADPSKIAENTRDVALDFLAAGLDPERATIFVQNHLAQHAELHLYLSMITPLSWLERVPTYKDQIENLQEKDLATYGFLGYPLLQSADILLYGVQGGHLYVPVGADQVAHIEITREIARRFNHLYARAIISESGHPERSEGSAAPAILNEPETLLTPTPKLPGTDGRKMSKSYGNTLLLSDPEPELRRKLRPMVTDPARVRRTDPGNPDVCPVGDLHKVFSSAETLAKVYDGCTTASIGCIECKMWLADSLAAHLAPIQERRAHYEAHPELVNELLAAGNARAKLAADETLHSVKRAMGLG